MQNFFIITNRPKDKDLVVTNEVVDFLTSHGKKCECTTFNGVVDVPKDTHCILVLGGDGTLLRAANQTAHLDIPLLGINLGTLGFMAEVEKSSIGSALQALIDDNFEVEERMMLEGSIIKNGREVSMTHALNDIVLTRNVSMKILSFDIYVNGMFLNRYLADGLIVSTPTGSTGYNMSAGGPIVEPKAKLILLTPICPHSLSAKSIVLSADDSIEIKIHEGRNGECQQMAVNFDGGNANELCTGDSVRICTSGRVTTFIRLSKESFLDVLHKKMSDQ